MAAHIKISCQTKQNNAALQHSKYWASINHPTALKVTLTHLGDT